jgi:nucleotide-binding universal stress UspA family protein
MPTFKKILVPVDFDEPSQRALAYAVELAKPLGAEITILHAYELPYYGFPDGALIATAEMAGRILVGAQSAVAEMADRHENAGVAIKTLVREGPAPEEIDSVAKEIGADLVVMGTHGRRGLRRALLGSVTETVVRTSSRPVLTVHTES